MLGVYEKVDEAGRRGRENMVHPDDVDVGCSGPAVNSIRRTHMRPKLVKATAQEHSLNDGDNMTQRMAILREKVDDDDGARRLEAVPLRPRMDSLMMSYARNALVFP